MGAENETRESDKRVIKAIKEIVKRGNDAEVRADKDGKLKVFEVKKHIVRAE